MNELDNNAVQNGECPEETARAVQPVTEVTSITAPLAEASTKKKSRKGLKILAAIAVVILFLAFCAVSFLLGRSSDFDLSAALTSCNGEEAMEEAPEFLGAWSGDDHIFYISADGIIEIDGVGYTYTWDEKTITINTEDGENHTIRYKKTSNTIKLWQEGDKDNSVSVRRISKGDPDELCGRWTLGEAEVTFNEDGTAVIYGRDYTYTADAYEITCNSDAGTEYMFYTVDGDFLNLWLPGDSKRTLRFVSENSLIPQITGIWVDENGYDYMLFYSNGAVEMRDFSGFSNYDYGDTLEVYVDGDRFVMVYEGIKFEYSIELNGDCMKLYYMGELMDVCYHISTDTSLSMDEIELLWEMYSPTESA